VAHGARLWERITSEILNRVDILPLGEAEALRAGDLLATLEFQGEPIGIEDVGSVQQPSRTASSWSPGI